MDEYLALIRKSDFIDLFKYGFFHVNRDLSVEVKGDLNCIREHDAYFNNFKDHVNGFESSFEYLFLLYKGINGNSDDEKGCKIDNLYRPKDILIENVLAVIPFDEEARREFSISFDKRIKIETPLWSDKIHDFQKERDKANHKKGAENIWKIWDIKEDISFCSNIITEEIVNKVLELFYNNSRPSGDLSVWVYLLMYERHAFYHKNDITGVFMDIVNVFCNFYSKKEVDSSLVQTTDVYNVLESFTGENLTIGQIRDLLNEKARPFVEKINEIESSIDFIKTAALYLLLKQHYYQGLYIEEKFINNCKEIGEKEFALAAYMFGIVLGYDNTYECLYDKLHLAIFKEKEPAASKSRQKEEPTVEAYLFPKDTDMTEDINFPCTMIKYKKDNTPDGRCNPKKVTTKEEYLEKINKDWRVVKN